MINANEDHRHRISVSTVLDAGHPVRHVQKLYRPNTETKKCYKVPVLQQGTIVYKTLTLYAPPGIRDWKQ